MNNITAGLTCDLFYVYNIETFKKKTESWQKLIKYNEFISETDFTFASNIPWRCQSCQRIWIFDDNSGRVMGSFRYRKIVINHEAISDCIKFYIFSEDDQITLDEIWDKLEKSNEPIKGLSEIPAYTYIAYVEPDFSKFYVNMRDNKIFRQYDIEQDRRHESPDRDFEF